MLVEGIAECGLRISGLRAGRLRRADCGLRDGERPVLPRFPDGSCRTSGEVADRPEGARWEIAECGLRIAGLRAAGPPPIARWFVRAIGGGGR